MNKLLRSSIAAKSLGVTGIVNLPTLDEVGPRASLDDMTRYIENYANAFIGKV